MHVAIIMDGNGRWAEQRGLPRVAGHRAGARAVRRTVEAAVRTDVQVLTLYAFSSDNWSRPTVEVEALMRLLKRYLLSEAARCQANGVRINVIGRRDRLARDLVRTIEQAERLTAHGRKLLLRLAVDYSARAAIAAAAALACTPAAFAERLAGVTHSLSAEPVDLLIRTGGERRLSDFLLFESAYAELLFLDRHWPDFDEAVLEGALREFARRHRRFGGLPMLQSTAPAEEASLS